MSGGRAGRVAWPARTTVHRTVSARRAGLGTPLAMALPALVAVALLVLPTVGLLVRMPWSRLGAIYRTQHVWTAVRVSVTSALEATAVALVLGVPLAWVLARSRLPGLAVLRALVTVPLVLPPVMGGLAIFAAFGRFGIVGDQTHALLGGDLPFTYLGIVVAQVFVAMPFLVITVEGAFRIADRGVEEAAATLGASRSRIVARVTVPMIAPAIVSGAVLCWARALGEFGATLLVGGDRLGRTQTLTTLTLDVFNGPGGPQDATAIALPLLAVALIVLGGLRDRWLRPVAG